MKFKLQGIDTDLEIELKRSKRYYDWSNEGKPDYLKTNIIFCDDLDACPVGTVEWITQELRAPLFPVLLPTDLDYMYVGRKIGQFSGAQVPDLPFDKVFIKSGLTVKHQDNGWYAPKESLTEGFYTWSEKFKSPILGEFRVFLGRRGEILDIRNYIGYSVWPDIRKVKNLAEILYNKHQRAISFDVVVLEDRNTYLLEIHDYWALGLYGFSDLKTIPFLVWDWYRMTKKYENT